MANDTRKVEFHKKHLTSNYRVEFFYLMFCWKYMYNFFQYIFWPLCFPCFFARYVVFLCWYEFLGNLLRSRYVCLSVYLYNPRKGIQMAVGYELQEKLLFVVWNLSLQISHWKNTWALSTHKWLTGTHSKKKITTVQQRVRVQQQVNEILLCKHT